MNSLTGLIKREMTGTKLILIRHGQTDWNKQKKYCGFTDIDLNNAGIIQAEELRKELNAKAIARVYTSRLKRCVTFTELIFKNTPIEKLIELNEMNFGIWEGLTYYEIMAKYHDVYRKWLNKPCETAIPQGESLGEMAMRVRKVLIRILSINKGKTIATVTHSGPIKVILCNVLGLNLDDIWQIEPGLASVREIEFDERGKGKIV